MSNMGITNAGKDTNDDFCKTTGFQEPKKKNDARGDAFKIVNSNEIWVEVKKTTLNQVRPNKYVVVVAHNPPEDNWYVIPPNEIMKMLVGKSNKVRRGQHTSDPMTCVGLGRITDKKYNKFKQTKDNLYQAVVDAYLAGQAATAFKLKAETHKKNEEENTKKSNEELLLLTKE
jgi:hypothetical protein